MILHIENKMPLGSISFLEDNSGLLLLQDAIYALLQLELMTNLLKKNINIYILEDEVNANNISINDNILEKINIINYDTFVKLIEEYEKTYSW